MDRTTLPLDEGMLFVFNPPEQARFWMKNTPLSLDILFIDERGTVVITYSKTTPYSLKILESEYPVKWVFEINAKRSQTLKKQGKFFPVKFSPCL
jgi:uncharacterized protein